MRFVLSLVLSALSFFSFAQMQVKGRVTAFEEKNQALPGVTVVIQNSLLGTVTQEDGSFQLGPLEEGEYVLEFRMMGRKTQYKKFSADGPSDFQIEMAIDNYQMDAFTVVASRASESAPFAKTEVSKEELEKINLAQDMPILLNQLTSVVTTSDAGAGVGYTGMRIRGSDATRINVTVNGIPLNDSESQGVFWVNMPDFASSTKNIQVQRGVGSSSNGSGAFGASVNLQSDVLKRKAYAQVSNSFGSFNTRKHSLQFGSGLINEHFAFDGRLSSLHSDGFIDRASADLRSYYFSAGYYGKKDVIRFITFAGFEETYQSWWGTPQSRIENDIDGMNLHADNNGLTQAQRENLLNSGRTYNYYEYDNQVDHYQQDHYQLHWSHEFNSKLRWQNSAHFTYGRGYFEEFKEGESFSDYGLANLRIGGDTISTTDLIRRRWLDNDFFGLVSNLIWKMKSSELIIGLNAHQYEGDHFGEVVWAGYALDSELGDTFYDSRSYKTDLSGFAKWQVELNSRLSVYADLQMRVVDYRSRGTDNDLREIAIDTSMNFFNPKLGLRYRFSDLSSVFLSYSKGSREPTRSDFVDAPFGTTPVPEILHDFETGWNLKRQRWMLDFNLYCMYYINQLVLTGELNDVGASVRANAPNSYRAGLELAGRLDPKGPFSLEMNVSLSQNKIQTFEEIVYDYTTGFDVITNVFENTDISFSPSTVGFIGAEFSPRDKAGLNVRWKYVGKQYLDNTSNEDRAIDAYNTLDFLLFYNWKKEGLFKAQFKFLINNALNLDYSSNGYTYSYVFGTQVTENFYYPQAGVNFLVGLDLSF